MASVRAERQSNPDAISDSFDLLDQYYLREPQLVRRPQGDRNRCTGYLCAIGCCRDLPRLGTRSTVFRNYADFQHTVAQRSCAAVVRLRRVSDTVRVPARQGQIPNAGDVDPATAAFMADSQVPQGIDALRTRSEGRLGNPSPAGTSRSATTK